ncbi:MAG: hypothetical protein LKI25_02430 [Atopobiaceae bacterium]|jgi:hypothetical protein|nr:hypothetical protein [Atopobiaceae bacterium]MCI2173064.1 hypothetical protein [Atopobiaceae bacterium]MCI2208157.1 hypothetical protein [Atopobiaceae bacterium]
MKRTRTTMGLLLIAAILIVGSLVIQRMGTTSDTTTLKDLPSTAGSSTSTDATTTYVPGAASAGYTTGDATSASSGDIDPDGTWPTTGSRVSMTLDVLSMKSLGDGTYRCSLVSQGGTTFVTATLSTDAAEEVYRALDGAKSDGTNASVTISGTYSGLDSLTGTQKRSLTDCTVTR